MSERLKDLRKNLDVVLPEDLDRVIHKAIERGQRDMRRRKTGFRALKAAICVLFLLAGALTAGLNTVPAFAEAVGGIQGLAGILRVLQFDGGRAGGGEITDGQDIGPIDWGREGDVESVLIRLRVDGAPAGLPGSFEILREEYPLRLVLHLHGVRGMSVEDIEVPEDSRFLEAIYPLVTLDDSSRRLALTFKKAVAVTVAEGADPAGILITLGPAPEEADLPQRYALRTPSLEYGEQVGVWEEVLTWEHQGKGVRMLKDKDGGYFVEEGLYETEEEAQSRRVELRVEGLDFRLVVERVHGYGPREHIGE